jgi:hypothetical protein
VNSTRPTIEFDLTRPLEPQLESVKTMLQNRQKRMIREGIVDAAAVGRRARRPEYRNYLRVLDALEEKGFPRSEVVPVPALEDLAEDLVPHGKPLPTQNLRKWISAARRLRDHDYRHLPALEGRAGK